MAARCPPNTSRVQLFLPTGMKEQMEALAQKRGTTASEVLRKSLTLYLHAAEKEDAGMKIGFAKDPKAFDTEVIGL